MEAFLFSGLPLCGIGFEDVEKISVEVRASSCILHARLKSSLSSMRYESYASMRLDDIFMQWQRLDTFQPPAYNL